MNYEKRITQVTVLPEGEPIFSEQATVIQIEDEAGGEYITLSQNRDDSEAKIGIDPEEWPVVRDAIEEMFKTLRNDDE